MALQKNFGDAIIRAGFNKSAFLGNPHGEINVLAQATFHSSIICANAPTMLPSRPHQMPFSRMGFFFFKLSLAVHSVRTIQATTLQENFPLKKPNVDFASVILGGLVPPILRERKHSYAALKKITYGDGLHKIHLARRGRDPTVFVMRTLSCAQCTRDASFICIGPRGVCFFFAGKLHSRALSSAKQRRHVDTNERRGKWKKTKASNHRCEICFSKS